MRLGGEGGGTYDDVACEVRPDGVGECEGGGGVFGARDARGVGDHGFELEGVSLGKTRERRSAYEKEEVQYARLDEYGHCLFYA